MTMAATNNHWHRAVLVFLTMCSICHASELETSTLAPPSPSLTYTCPPKVTSCDCPKNTGIGRSLLFNCPPPETAMTLVYTLVYDIEAFQLTMECVDIKLDYSLLRLQEFKFPRVDSFVMRNCPLPNGSFGGVIDGLNVTTLKIIPSTGVNKLPSNLFQNVSQIQYLDIEGGNIQTIENGSFKDLTSLQSLKISQNALGVLPTNIFDEMPSLISLNLDSNMIEELPLLAFEKLPKLQNLSLNSNHIKNLNNSVFQNLVNLRNLKLMDSNLLDSLGENVFKTLFELESVDLSSTSLRTLPETLFVDNRKLQTISLRKNSELAELPALLFQNSVLLRRLELDDNNLTEVPINLFSTLTNLRILNLSKNRIKTIPDGLFDNNKKLSDIDLSINQITALPSHLFRAQTELRAVNLHNNLLSVVSRLEFSLLPTLDTLDLSDNEISIVDNLAFEGSGNITTLDLSNNNLSFAKEAFTVPHNIRYLNLSHNKLTNFPEHEWNNVPYILLINLTNNHLESLNIPQLMFQSKKVTMDVRRNDIKTVNLLNMEKYFTPSTNKPDVPSIMSVPTIFIEDNPINCDCNLLSFVQYVKRHNSDVEAPFRFQANNLKCASPNDQMLLGMKMSQLYDDNLYCLVDELCDERCICKRSSVSKTLTVDCRPTFISTRLKEFPKTAPANTSKLLLQNNNIASMSVLKEEHWRNLTEVYLSNNAIQLDDVPVHLPKHLRLLELSNNSIENMPQWLMTEVSYKDDLTLTLGGNPWRCDCSTVKFHQWLSELPASKSKVSDPSGVRCGNGSHANEKLLKLRLSKFCTHHRAGPGGPILVTVFSALILLGVAVIAGVLLTRNRHRIKMWCFRHKMCLWMRTQDDIEAGHPL